MTKTIQSDLFELQAEHHKLSDEIRKFPLSTNMSDLKRRKLRIKSKINALGGQTIKSR